jgi:hypothetical protein
MALSEQVKDTLWRNYMKRSSRLHETYQFFSKEELRSAVDIAEDDLIDCYVSFNGNIPTNVRDGLNKKQKIKILKDTIDAVWAAENGG